MNELIELSLTEIIVIIFCGYFLAGLLTIYLNYIIELKEDAYLGHRNHNKVTNFEMLLLGYFGLFIIITTTNFKILFKERK